MRMFLSRRVAIRAPTARFASSDKSQGVDPAHARTLDAATPDAEAAALRDVALASLARDLRAGQYICHSAFHALYPFWRRDSLSTGALLEGVRRSVPSSILPLLTGLSIADAGKMDELLAAKRTIEEKVADLKKAASIIQNLATIQNLERDCESARQSVRSCFEVVTAVLRDVNRLRDAYWRLHEANACLKEANGHLREARGRLREANVRLDEAYARFREANGRLDEANARLREANARLDEANARLDDLDLSITFLVSLQSRGKKFLGKVSYDSRFTDRFAFGMLGRDEEPKLSF